MLLCLPRISRLPQILGAFPLRSKSVYHHFYLPVIPMASGNKRQVTLARFFTSVKNDAAKIEKTAPESSDSGVTQPQKRDDPPQLDQATSPLKKRLKRLENGTTKSTISELSTPVGPSSSSPATPSSSRVNTADTDPKETNKPFVSKVPFIDLCKLFEEVEGTSSRLAIIKLCADFFVQVMKQDSRNLIPITYLCINKLGPDYLPGLELGLGEGLLMKTISEAYGKSLSHLKEEYKETGDLGQIAMTARKVQPTMFKPTPLTVGEVFQNLQTIASSQGKDSQSKKIRLIKRMLTACEGIEAKFLIRSLESKLRIGLAEKTVLISLSKALLIHEYGEKSKTGVEVDDMGLAETAEAKIRDAYCQVPNYEIIINCCLEYGIMQLDKHCSLQPGIPLKPMLAKPTKSITEVLDTFQGKSFTSEYKYDGERAQVHLLENGEMRIYSRNGENMTERYPEINIRDFLSEPETANNMILDCEAVAWDKENQKILPFQVLSTRKRKDVDIKDVKVRVCLFAFDILCYNNEKLIGKSLRERREYLRRVTREVPGEFQYATQLTTDDLDELRQFLDQSIKHSCEGLMVKMLEGEESHYEPSKRSRNWLKLKKDYLEGVGDSFDLCVLGAYYGKGKRTGTYGGFLLGCYNQDTGEFETACKIGTGFSEEMLQQLYQRLQPTVIDGPKAFYVYDSSAEPDIWFEPTLLFEVLAADLSLSPIYKAGSTSYDKGISLRFPRFIRLREDKGVEDATSSEQIIEFYESQSHLQK